MKLLINTSSLSGTGVTQVAVSFITECIDFPENEYYVFLSSSVEKNLNLNKFPNNFKFFLFNNHPFYGIKGYKVKSKLITLEKEINPDCVFSIFGPSYWTPTSPHLMGYAYPHYVYPESPIFKIMSLKENLIFKLRYYLHKYYLKKNGKFYVCETEDVSQRLTSLLNIHKEQIYTVNNTCNHYFRNFKNTENGSLMLKTKSENEFRFLSLCTPYKHKNLTILNKVIPLLNSLRPDIKVRFILTIDNYTFNNIFIDSVKNNIINIGPISIDKCPNLYTECDALFLPTLLECFSANYPEAMCMGKPILTSNLSFATSICGDAGLYFDPLNPVEITNQIFKLIDSKELYNKLCKNGTLQFKLFNTSKQRAKEYLRICKSISSIDTSTKSV